MVASGIGTKSLFGADRICVSYMPSPFLVSGLARSSVMCSCMLKLRCESRDVFSACMANAWRRSVKMMCMV